MIRNLLNLILIFYFNLSYIIASESTYFVETTENRHIDLNGGRIHRHVITTTELNQPTTGCPAHNIFSPCECNEVSFDGNTYQTQISCKGLSGKEIQR